MNSLKIWLRSAIWRCRRVAGIDRQLILSGQILAETNRQKTRLRKLSDAEFSVFSQWGEDGIIAWLIDTIGVKHHSFLEFGVEDYRESNTRFLLTTRNWQGVVIDGSTQNIATIVADDISYRHDLTALTAFITAETIGDLIRKSGLPSHIGLLSVDIDGVDWWVLEQINIEADIIIVEYNSFFGHQPVTVPYRADFVRSKAHWSNVYWGASLPAFRYLLEGRGYVFVGSNSVGTNAFFVHRDHASRIADVMPEGLDHPCRLRDTRNPDGSLARKHYDAFASTVEELPVVRVDTRQTITLGEAKSA